MYPRTFTLLFCLLLVILAGCAAMATQRLAGNLSQAILNQDDPATVRAGAPAYLLLIDGLIEGDPNNPDLLMAGARLYASYATVFVEDPERAQRLADKAFGYARHALCSRRPQTCDLHNRPYDEFEPILATMKRTDLPVLYTYAAAWGGRIQTRRSDWNAVAELPKVQAAMARVVELDESFERGQPYLYLGIMHSQLPPSLGGRPEQGRAYFEQAITLSQGRNLMAKVEFARHYARLVFDRSLHDQLLGEVLAANPDEPGLTLSNTLAQQQARQLLDSSSDYFLE